MNIEEKNQILATIEGIEKFNFSEEVAKHFKDSPEMDSIAIGRYPVKEFISFFNRAIRQLKAEFQTDNYFFYPLQAQAQPIAGIHILSTLGQILGNLQQSQITQIAALLDQLITYEYYYGIWHLSTYKIHSLKGLDIEKKNAEIDLLKKKLELSITQFQEKIAELNETKNQVSEFLAVKQQELAQIANNQTKSTTETQQITTLLQNSTKTNSDLNAILAVQNEKLAEINAELESEQKAFSEYEANASLIEEKLTAAMLVAEEKLKIAENKLTYIESKRDEITRLVGLAADGSLGYKFDDRKTQIEKGLKFWSWMVPGITVLSIIWVVIVFTCLSAKMDPYWLGLVINVIKTFPVFILMGFVFRQYSRERNIQEEYAFKAAVAMTITSYSDMLKDQDTAQNKTRQEMLIKAITEVYNSSKLQPEVKQRLLSFSTKDLKETVAQLTEALGQMKNISK